MNLPRNPMGNVFFEKRIACVNKEMSTRGNGAGSPTLLQSDIGFMRTIYQRGYYIYGALLLSTQGCPRARVRMIPNTPLQTNTSPNPLTCLSCLTHGNAFVKMSAVCSGSQTLMNSMMASCTKSRTQCQHISICLAL